MRGQGQLYQLPQVSKGEEGRGASHPMGPVLESFLPSGQAHPNPYTRAGTAVLPMTGAGPALPAATSGKGAGITPAPTPAQGRQVVGELLLHSRLGAHSPASVSSAVLVQAS